MADERCAWCGTSVEAQDGYRLAEPAGGRRAAFCRLEHVVPWALRGARFEPGDTPPAVAVAVAELEACARCGGPLPDTRLELVRHRGEHQIPDAFCSVEHLCDWAKAGGRWAL